MSQLNSGMCCRICRMEEKKDGNVKRPLSQRCPCSKAVRVRTGMISELPQVFPQTTSEAFTLALGPPYLGLQPYPLTIPRAPREKVVKHLLAIGLLFLLHLNRTTTSSSSSSSSFETATCLPSTLDCQPSAPFSILLDEHNLGPYCHYRISSGYSQGVMPLRDNRR